MADRRHSTDVVIRPRRSDMISMRDRRREVVTREDGRAMTAAVQPLDTYNSQTLVIQPTEWQREAWGYYHSIGEFNFAIDSWLSNALSRVRLYLGQITPGSDEPTPVTEGPLAQIVANLAGGIAGQAQMLKRLAVQLSVPGDSYIVHEDLPNPANGYPGQYPDVRTFRTYSNSEIRIVGRSPVLSYQVNSERAIWRPLAKESLVSRVWWPDPEFQWRATSPAEAALPILREIDMYNRYIIAMLLSRVASNGLLFIPEEITLPVKPQFKDAADPFMAELIEIGSRGVKNPGSASAAFPMPIKVKGEWIEKIKHMTFATDISEHIVEHRDRALVRLANTCNMPAGVTNGNQDANHWSAWQTSEDSVKIHMSPICETIVQALTETYLAPMAAAAGLSLFAPDGSQYVIWYDPSALVQQPDRSGEAKDAHDRLVISDEAYLREIGLDAADAPTTEQLKNQALRLIVSKGGPDSLAALSVLVGDPSIALIPQRVTVTDPTTTPPDQLGDPNAPAEPAGPTNVPKGPPPAGEQAPPQPKGPPTS